MKKAAAVALAILVGACTSTEMPIAKNRVRIDTHTQGLAFVGSAPAMTMVKAAEATLKRGYTHFRLEDAATSQGRRITGFYNDGYFITPVGGPTADIGVTVVMYHASDSGARGAWDAAEVLRKKGRV